MDERKQEASRDKRRTFQRDGEDTFFPQWGGGKAKPNRDIRRKDNWTWKIFMQNHTIFSIDQSNDMRYRNRELTRYIKQKIITADIYIYI